MKVHQRLLLVLIVLLGAFAASYRWDLRRQQRTATELFNKVLTSELTQMQGVLKLETQRVQTYANDYSWWDEMVHYCETRDVEWWQRELMGSPQLYDADAAWLMTVDLECIGKVTREGVPPVPAVPFFQNKLRSMVSRGVFGHMFAYDGGELWEIWFAPVQPSDDRQRITAPVGYFVVGREWNASLMERLSALTGADYQLLTADTASHMLPADGSAETGVLHLVHLLKDDNGQVVAGLGITKTSPMLPMARAQFVTNQRWMLWGVGGAAFFTILACVIWVTRPLSKITEALERNDMSILQRLGRRGSEMGLIARLLESEAMQRTSLETEVRRRADAELKLAQREHFLSTILRHLNGVVLVISRDGVLNLVDGRDVEAFGMRKDRDEGRQINRIFRGQDRLLQFEAALNGRRISEEQQVGERYFLTMCEPLLGKGGRVDLIVVLALDITEKKEVEAALRRAKADAERADKLKTQFLSVMSHETRTPLNGVLGFAGVLRDTPLDEEQLGYLDRIVESGQNLLRLLTDILDLTRLEAGENKAEIDPVSLTALIFQFAERYRIAATKKGLLFDLEVEPALPEYVETDSEKVSRILGSLLDNAVKFTDHGAVKFIVKWHAEGAGGPAVSFIVSDTGQGIPREIQDHIFDPFQQADSSKTRRHGGLGLGLTIAHRLARQVAGILSFETEERKGSRFTFFLPVTVYKDEG